MPKRKRDSIRYTGAYFWPKKQARQGKLIMMPIRDHKIIRQWADRHDAMPAQIHPRQFDGQPAILYFLLEGSGVNGRHRAHLMGVFLRAVRSGLVQRCIRKRLARTRRVKADANLGCAGKWIHNAAERSVAETARLAVKQGACHVCSL